MELMYEYPPTFYRYFREKRHAYDFLNGKIWISTLETCRKRENPMQGDVEEACEIYQVTKFDNLARTKRDQKIAERISFFAEMDADFPLELEEITFVKTVIQDAYLVCFSLEYYPEAFEKDFGS